MLFKIITLLFVFLFNALLLTAQQFDWKVGFHGFADNRENANSRRISQTFFGARLSPEFGVVIDSIHRIAGGISYLQEFGSKSYNNVTKATLYYQYNNKGLEFNIGAFSRYAYINDFPLAILSDTISYYKPNIEGLLIKYHNKRFSQLLWLDWDNRQTPDQREQFKVGMSGTLHISPIFYFKHYAILWHNSRAGEYHENDHIRDNTIGSAFIGTDLSEKMWFDSLSLQIGVISNLDRLRGVYDWRLAKGLLSEIYLEKHKIFIRNTYYKGQSLQIPYGDKFYRTNNYDRIDLGYIPLRYKNLESRFTASFHFSKGVVDNQQQFILKYMIGNTFYDKKR